MTAWKMYKISKCKKGPISLVLLNEYGWKLVYLVNILFPFIIMKKYFQLISTMADVDKNQDPYFADYPQKFQTTMK